MGFFNMENQVVIVYGQIVKPGPEFLKNNEVLRPVYCKLGRYYRDGVVNLNGMQTRAQRAETPKSDPILCTEVT